MRLGRRGGGGGCGDDGEELEVPDDEGEDEHRFGEGERLADAPAGAGGEREDCRVVSRRKKKRDVNVNTRVSYGANDNDKMGKGDVHPSRGHLYVSVSINRSGLNSWASSPQTIAIPGFVSLATQTQT